jgi:2-(1,2-epoxy-1,2-dihydrophenyl)acetyl-CoA isomerase
MGHVKVEFKDHLAVVTIDRSQRRNALTAAVCIELAQAIRDAAEKARVVVLTGAGSAFCAGGDFQELARYAAGDPKEAAKGLYDGFQGMIRAIREVPVPVIAAVNGHAMGAGMDLALACDIRIMSDDAKLGQVWVKVGLIPGTAGGYWVDALAGGGRASEAILTGEPVSAETALSWGLVNEVVALEWVMPRAEELAKLLSESPPEALAANKKLLNDVVYQGYEEALEKSRDAQVERFASDEFRQAIGALQEEAEG